MATWYEKVDAFLGGVLPGGVGLETPFFSSAEEAATPGGVSGYAPQSAAQAPSYPLAPAMPAMPAAAPQAAGSAAPRGRLMTIVARQFADGTTIPIKVTPGGVALYQRDLAAVRRLRRAARRLRGLLPARPRFVRAREIRPRVVAFRRKAG